jgi:hypothetical protein
MAALSPDITPADEVLDFLLSAPTPEAVIELHPSEAAQERLRYLLDGNRNESLTDSERAELDANIQLEHFVRQRKIRAREKLEGTAWWREYRR